MATDSLPVLSSALKSPPVCAQDENCAKSFLSGRLQSFPSCSINPAFNSHGTSSLNWFPVDCEAQLPTVPNPLVSTVFDSHSDVRFVEGSIAPLHIPKPPESDEGVQESPTAEPAVPDSENVAEDQQISQVRPPVDSERTREERLHSPKAERLCRVEKALRDDERISSAKMALVESLGFTSKKQKLEMDIVGAKPTLKLVEPPPISLVSAFMHNKQSRPVHSTNARLRTAAVLSGSSVKDEDGNTIAASLATPMALGLPVTILDMEKLIHDLLPPEKAAELDAAQEGKKKKKKAKSLGSVLFDRDSMPHGPTIPFLLPETAAHKSGLNVTVPFYNISEGFKDISDISISNIDAQTKQFIRNMKNTVVFADDVATVCVDKRNKVKAQIYAKIFYRQGLRDFARAVKSHAEMFPRHKYKNTAVLWEALLSLAVREAAETELQKESCAKQNSVLEDEKLCSVSIRSGSISGSLNRMHRARGTADRSQGRDDDSCSLVSATATTRKGNAPPVSPTASGGVEDFLAFGYPDLRIALPDDLRVSVTGLLRIMQTKFGVCSSTLLTALAEILILQYERDCIAIMGTALPSDTPASISAPPGADASLATLDTCETAMQSTTVSETLVDKVLEPKMTLRNKNFCASKFLPPRLPAAPQAHHGSSKHSGGAGATRHAVSPGTPVAQQRGSTGISISTPTSEAGGAASGKPRGGTPEIKGVHPAVVMARLLPTATVSVYWFLSLIDGTLNDYIEPTVRPKFLPKKGKGDKAKSISDNVDDLTDSSEIQTRAKSAPTVPVPAAGKTKAYDALRSCFYALNGVGSTRMLRGLPPLLAPKKKKIGVEDEAADSSTEESVTNKPEPRPADCNRFFAKITKNFFVPDNTETPIESISAVRLKAMRLVYASLPPPVIIDYQAKSALNDIDYVPGVPAVLQPKTSVGYRALRCWQLYRLMVGGYDSILVDQKRLEGEDGIGGITAENPDQDPPAPTPVIIRKISPQFLNQIHQLAYDIAEVYASLHPDTLMEPRQTNDTALTPGATTGNQNSNSEPGLEQTHKRILGAAGIQKVKGVIDYDVSPVTLSFKACKVLIDSMNILEHTYILNLPALGGVVSRSLSWEYFYALFAVSDFAAAGSPGLKGQLSKASLKRLASGPLREEERMKYALAFTFKHLKSVQPKGAAAKKIAKGKPPTCQVSLGPGELNLEVQLQEFSAKIVNVFMEPLIRHILVTQFDYEDSPLWPRVGELN